VSRNLAAMRRVVVTGLGSVNAFGIGVPAFLAGLRSGRSAIGEMTVFPSGGFRSRRAAVAPAEAAASWLCGPAARRLSRSDRMALEAAREAWTAAGIAADGFEPTRAGVWLGATTGGMLEAEEGIREVGPGEPLRATIRRFADFPVHVTGDLVAGVLAIEGPCTTVVTACSSSANAIGFAADAIRAKRVDVALAGGVDAHCRMTYAGFNALQALDPGVCRPFDRRRAGLSLGEGAAILVLEDAERAGARGATILAEIAGYGMSADAHHMTAPHPEGAGAILAMQRALADAGLPPEAIDYVNAHGTGTVHNDPAETRAIRAALGAHAGRVAVSSTKSQVGHCLGAAGAVELVATVLAIAHGFAPPTANLEEADPACDLDYVPGTARPLAIGAAISNSYGFGGNDTSVVVRRFERR
jgi:3-oxoacyl-[acyl-carrier-protein] synthase II